MQFYCILGIVPPNENFDSVLRISLEYIVIYIFFYFRWTGRDTEENVYEMGQQTP